MVGDTVVELGQLVELVELGQLIEVMEVVALEVVCSIMVYIRGRLVVIEDCRAPVLHQIE